MITINIDKAKNIAHSARRADRAAKMAPLDLAIAAKIPGQDAKAVEAQRQEIRDVNAIVQKNIDAATTPEQIKMACPFLG